MRSLINILKPWVSEEMSYNPEYANKLIFASKFIGNKEVLVESEYRFDENGYLQREISNTYSRYYSYDSKNRPIIYLQNKFIHLKDGDKYISKKTEYFYSDDTDDMIDQTITVKENNRESKITYHIDYYDDGRFNITSSQHDIHLTFDDYNRIVSVDITPRKDIFIIVIGSNLLHDAKYEYKYKDGKLHEAVIHNRVISEIQEYRFCYNIDNKISNINCTKSQVFENKESKQRSYESIIYYDENISQIDINHYSNNKQVMTVFNNTRLPIFTGGKKGYKQISYIETDTLMKDYVEKGYEVTNNIIKDMIKYRL